MGGTGFEHTAFSSGSTAFSRAGAAESAAVDADLAEVVAAWPGLPERARAEVLAILWRDAQ